jgi:peroxiredoxin
VTVRAQWAVVAAVVVALGLGLFAVANVMGDELFPVQIGSRSPDWTANTLDSTAQAKTGADYNGQVVLLNIWATWCGPCRVEMPSLEALHRSYAREGLKIVAVSVDDPGKQPAIQDFAREYGLTFEILHDPSARIRRIFQTTGVPETFIIGPEGVIRKKVIGADDWNSEGNRGLIVQLLRERQRLPRS